ncbi:MAG: hypothetical protein JXB32_09330 [Deltaproteobacteria bacterium]|nr:hypothetical protein [Deltaproteobacteria bacterium]
MGWGGIRRAGGVPFVLWWVAACSSTPPPGDGVHRTYERADVGTYTGGWRGGALEAGATEPDGGDETLEASDPAADGDGAGEAVVVVEGGDCPAGVACGRVWWTRSYCGGARPPDELLEELARPVPRDHTQFVVRPGTVHDPRQPVTTRVSTDAEGRFSFAAAAGDYCLVTVDKHDFLGPQGDPAAGEAIPVPIFGSGVAECMDRWARTCDGVVRIAAEPTPATEFTLHEGCSENPCLPTPPRP